MSELASQRALHRSLASHPGLVVAISGGVDSAVLLTAAVEALGAEAVLAVIAVSASLASPELADARRLAGSLGVDLIELRSTELEDERYRRNDPQRCYWCKESLFQAALPLAQERGWPLAYGENAEDDPTDRAGSRSAQERGVLAPLREVGWGKAEVRRFAWERRLPMADKPAAPCLASRIATGQPVTLDVLESVGAIEAELKGLGFRVLRARHLGESAMALEFAPEEMATAEAMAGDLVDRVGRYGYGEVQLRPYGR